MATQFFNYPGTEESSELYHYSQAVRIGNLVKTSGQGGWDEQGKIAPGLGEQILVAFRNAEKAIQSVDPSLSFENIHSIRSYHLDMDASFETMVATIKKLFPNHRPIWTCVQIGKLGQEGMQVEIEVEASIP